jgi:hypothetical protein
VRTRDALDALEEKNLLPLPRIEPIFLDRQAPILVTIRNTLDKNKITKMSSMYLFKRVACMYHHSLV